MWNAPPPNPDLVGGASATADRRHLMSAIGMDHLDTFAVAIKLLAMLMSPRAAINACHRSLIRYRLSVDGRDRQDSRDEPVQYITLIAVMTLTSIKSGSSSVKRGALIALGAFESMMTQRIRCCWRG